MSLSEYQENLDKFYKLKNKYYEKINREKQKIMQESKLSKKEKRIQFNQLGSTCINCKSKGGTIFESTKEFYRITCGNITKPCNINLYFKRETRNNLNDLLVKYINIISELKEEIIKIKLNYILGFITKENSIIEFNKIKDELSKNYKIYTELLENHLNIINNNNNKDEITIKLKEKQEMINEIKNHIDKYNFDGNISEIKEIIELYINDLSKIIEELQKLQYKNYYIYSKDDINYLIRDTYIIKDLEVNI